MYKNEDKNPLDSSRVVEMASVYACAVALQNAGNNLSIKVFGY